MIRQEQCNKVCRILDDVLANRSTERDSLIVAVREAFDALEKQRWIPCSVRLPEVGQAVIVTTKNGYRAIRKCIDAGHLKWFYNDVIAWMPSPEPYREGGEQT